MPCFKELNKAKQHKAWSEMLKKRRKPAKKKSWLPALIDPDNDGEPIWKHFKLK
jgi:hypothetical protein